MIIRLYNIYIISNLSYFTALALFNTGHTIRMTGPDKQELIEQLQLKVNKFLQKQK